MKRTLFLMLTILLVLASSTAPLMAKEHDDDKDNGKEDAKTTAEACKKDGWKLLADDDGEPFKNQGQCSKYAKDGGEFDEIDDESSNALKDDDDHDNDDDDESNNALNDDDNDGDATQTLTTVDSNNDDAATDAQQANEPVLKIIDGTKPWDGYLEGTGFTPGEELTKVTFESERETLNLTSPVGTLINDDGTFTTERIIYWCSEFHGHGETSGIVTVEDSAGESYSQTFEMATYCGAKE